MNKLSVCTIIMALIVVSGCASSSPKKLDKTTASMDAVQSEINKLSVQLDATEASLNNLTSASSTEYEEAFKQYKENVTKIMRMGSSFSRHSEDMRAKGNDYFTEWQQEGDTYENPQLREVSDQRRQELSKSFNRVTENSGEVNRSLKQYINDLKEIESYLSNDLTPKGITAVAPLGKKVKENGKVLKGAVNQMQTSIAIAKEEMGKVAT